MTILETLQPASGSFESGVRAVHHSVKHGSLLHDDRTRDRTSLRPLLDEPRVDSSLKLAIGSRAHHLASFGCRGVGQLGLEVL